MKREDRDLILVSGIFLEDKIPSDKYWLTHYFKTGVKFKFLVYYSIFKSHYHFSRHTGLHCTARYLCYLKNLLCDLEDLHKKSKKNFDLDTLSLLESGKYKIKRR